MFLRMLRAAGEHTAGDLLPQIDVPVLVVAGERDTFTPAFLAQRDGRGPAARRAPHGAAAGRTSRRSSSRSSSMPASSSSCSSASSPDQDQRSRSPRTPEGEPPSRKSREEKSGEFWDSASGESARYARRSCMRSATPSRYASHAASASSQVATTARSTVAAGRHVLEHHRATRRMRWPPSTCPCARVSVHRLGWAAVVLHEGVLADGLLAAAAHVRPFELGALVDAALDEDRQQRDGRLPRRPGRTARAGSPGSVAPRRAATRRRRRRRSASKPSPSIIRRKSSGCAAVPDSPPVCSS